MAGQIVPLTTYGAVARRACCTVFQPDPDSLLVFGGVGTSSYFNDAHILHLPSRQWSECYPAGAKPSARAGASGAMLRDTKTCFLFGGRGDHGLLGDAYLLDILTMTWSQVHASSSQSPSPREDGVLAEVTIPTMCTTPSSAAAVSHSPSVLLVGGCTATGACGEIWRFYTHRMQWDLVHDCAADVYPTGVAACAHVQSENELFLFGGYDSLGTFLDRLIAVRLVDGRPREIQIHGSVPRPRTHASMTLFDGTILIFGGYGKDEALGDVWQLFSVASELASCVLLLGEECLLGHGAGVVVSRGAASGVVSRGQWIIFGGCDGESFLQDALLIPLESFSRAPHRIATVSSVAPSHQAQSTAPSPSPPQRTGATSSFVHRSGGGGGVAHPYEHGGLEARATLRSTADSIVSDRGQGSHHGARLTNSSSGTPETQRYLSSHEASLSRHGRNDTAGTLRDLPGEGPLKEAISGLKAELFGPRTAQVDTLLEENRKLREENARLQRTILELTRSAH